MPEGLSHRFAEDMWYIKIRDDGSKAPLEAYGGWTDDTPFEDRDTVYTYEEAQESDWGHWAWIAHKDYQFFVVDIDWTNLSEHEDSPNPEEIEEIRTSEPLPQVKSQTTYTSEDGEEMHHGHFLFAYDGDEDFKIDIEGIDLKGEAGRGIALCPPTPGYTMANEWELPIFATTDEVVNAVTINGETIVEERSAVSASSTESGNYTGPGGSVYDLLNQSKYPAGARRPHPVHGSSTGANFMVDRDGETWRCWRHDCTGNLAHLIGIEHGIVECGEWTDGGQLTPDQWSEIFAVAEDNGIQITAEIDLSPYVPVDEHGNPAIQEEPPQFGGAGNVNVNVPLSLQSPARSGKSYSLVKLITDAIEAGHNIKVVFLGPSHDECEATFQKFLRTEFASRLGGATVAHLVGSSSERARDIPKGGDYRGDISPTTPEEAAQYDRGNVYQAYKDACLEADIIITHPSLLDDLEDYDLLVTAEEGVMQSMQLAEVGLLDIRPAMGHDRAIDFPILSKKPQLEALRDDIQELDQTDEYHGQVLTACQHLLNVCELMEEYSPGSWIQVQETFDEFIEEVDQQLSEIPDFDVNIQKIRNYAGNRLDGLILSTLHYAGLGGYGAAGRVDPEDEDSAWKRERLQRFLCPEPFTPAYEVPDDCTVWAAAAMRTPLDKFHEMYSDDVPEVWAFQPQTREFYDGNTKIFSYNGGDNPAQQTGHIRDMVRELQALRTDLSTLNISGSSDRAAAGAATRMNSYVPNSHDDMWTLERQSEIGGAVTTCVTSRFCNGVDTPYFQMGVVDHAFYAMPLIDFASQHQEDPSISKAYKMSDAQNAILRVTNTPDVSTGDTPVVLPSRHIPKELEEVLKAFGFTFRSTDRMDVLKTHVLSMLGTDATVTQEGQIRERRDGDARRMSWAQFRRRVAMEGEDGTTD